MNVYTPTTDTILYKAEERGHASHGWLDTYYSFSFANYYDPSKIHFGTLRVLNDDTIKGGFGFGKHPHDNMEIVTIPLYGDLEHRDSTGRHEIIRQNDVQIMSAGSGIEHSEKNANANKEVSLLQIWIFPKKRNITPRYEQKTFNPGQRQNKIQTVVAPDNKEAIWINQDAWFSLANLNAGFETTYSLKKNGNGAYVFLIEGAAIINGEQLKKRDAIGISNINEISIKADEKSEILLIDVPMQLS